jgi:hypothetical protein
MYKHELENFTRQADFYSLLAFYFSIYLEDPTSLDRGAPGKQPWRDIFREQVSYPPPANHPP